MLKARHPHRDEAQAGRFSYSMDANLLHISFEGRHLEDPAAEAEESMWRWTVSPEAARTLPNTSTSSSKGDLVAIDGTRMKAHELLAKLNELGASTVSDASIWWKTATSV